MRGSEKDGGFSLAEILLSLTLLTIVCLVLVGLLTGAQAGTGVNDEMLGASSIVEAHLQDLKSGSFGVLEAAVGTTVTNNVTVDGRDYRLETEISRVGTTPGQPDYSVLQLVTTATWISSGVDPSGRQREARVELQTQMGRSGRY